MRIIISIICLLFFACNPAKNAADKPHRNLKGTEWTISYANNDGPRKYNLVFKSKGHLYNTHPNEKTRHNDTWKQEVNKVVMSFNNGYAVYTGELIDKDYMKGEAVNEKGNRWDWEARRVK